MQMISITLTVESITLEVFSREVVDSNLVYTVALKVLNLPSMRMELTWLFMMVDRPQFTYSISKTVDISV